MVRNIKLPANRKGIKNSGRNFKKGRNLLTIPFTKF